MRPDHKKIMIEFTSTDPAICVITLNRPECRNALSGQMLEDFVQILDEIRAESSAKVVLIQGIGAGFCSGIDLKEAATSYETAEKMFAQVVDILVRLRKLRQTVITSASGIAYGGGSAIIAASDIAVASADLKIATPEVKRGFDPVLLFPLFRRKLSDAALRELILTGEPITASRAKEIGLVQYVLDEQSRQDFAIALAEKIVQNEPTAMVNAKLFLNAHDTMLYQLPLEDELRLSLSSHLESWKTQPAQEGVAAFVEKRQPVW